MTELDARKLTTERLATEAGATPDYIDRLVQAGAIRPDAEGRFAVGDIARVRLTVAFAEGGIDLDALMSVVNSGAVQLDWVARLWTVGDPTGRTFAEFAGSLGERASQLPAMYMAFGLAEPLAGTVMRHDEEAAILAFIDLWSLVDDRPETYLRAARIAGEGVRRIQGATQDLFDELGGPPGIQAARGRSPEEAIQPALRLGPSLSQLLVWLQVRHQESEVFSRIVEYVESVPDQTGEAARSADPPAVAFVDLSGYTELTVTAGDERAAYLATSLQALAETAARAHHGRVVKLLGDGVMLRYPSGQDAVESVRELLAAIVDAGLPVAHAGIATGPLVVRDGDVYGHTVNLAARIAGQAAPGDLLVPCDLADELAGPVMRWQEIGDVPLKGLADPVRLARLVQDPWTA